jgi:hypothetical protein
MDERDREWRERDWRRSESYGRGGEDRSRSDETERWDEERTWSAADDDEEPYEQSGRYRAGHGEAGDDYGARPSAPSGGASGRGGRTQAYRSGPGRMRYGGETGRADYGYRSRPYGGWEGPERRSYGYDYDPERRTGRAWEADEARAWRLGRLEDEDYDEARRFDGARGYEAADHDRWEERRERGREGPGDFLQRAGEQITSWFRGRDEDRDEPRRYRSDFGREARVTPDRSQRGVGPKGYRRSDERISDEVHERLTEDPWLDASNIEVQVKSSEVTLSGRVDNREAKHRAERLVEEISGVDHVQNNLRVDPALTGAGRGFGSSALEAEMRRNEQATSPENRGVSGLSGRTSTGAEAERSGETPVDPKAGLKRS